MILEISDDDPSVGRCVASGAIFVLNGDGGWHRKRGRRPRSFSGARRVEVANGVTRELDNKRSKASSFTIRSRAPGTRRKSYREHLSPERLELELKSDRRRDPNPRPIKAIPENDPDYVLVYEPRSREGILEPVNELMRRRQEASALLRAKRQPATIGRIDRELDDLAKKPHRAKMREWRL